MGQIEYNSNNKNKKGNLKAKERTTNDNIVSMGSKAKTIKKVTKK